jgi:hypothetical protein
MGVELLRNINLPCRASGISGGIERHVAANTDSQKCTVGVVFYDPKFSFRHENSLAPNACENATAPSTGLP